ncbi:hypothetical protein Bca4012_063176 [Brassica carinata]
MRPRQDGDPAEMDSHGSRRDLTSYLLSKPSFKRVCLEPVPLAASSLREFELVIHDADNMSAS